jgi:hypothetical protein
VGANSKLKREDIAVNGEVNKKSKAKNDIIFIAVILALILALGAFYVFSHGEGDTVTVTVGGVLYGEYPLSEGRTVEIKNGEAVNALRFETEGETGSAELYAFERLSPAACIFIR